MTVAVHARSCYADSANPAPDRPALVESVDCDVCVVGGGIAGCSTALHLAERGFRVVLLEAHHVGWGASGRSGAQAISGTATGQARLEELIGRADARHVWDVTVEGLALLRSLIARFRIGCDWRDGQMQVAMNPRQERDLRAELQLLRGRYGYESVRFVGREELRTMLASPRYTAGLCDTNGGHLHPLNYTLGLAEAAESFGARIFEDTRALSYARAPLAGAAASAPLRVCTPRGEVRCRQLVLAGNTYLGPLARALRPRIMAVGTQIIATERLGAGPAHALIPSDVAVSDLNWVLDYFRRSADHRLIFGGRVSYSGRDSFATAKAARARMLAVFPQLSGTGIDYAWGGQVDITRNRAPHFGRLEPDVYFLQGFSGHGIVLTGIAGKLIAEAIAGTAGRFDVFARIPHRSFPGGIALRRPALMLAMLGYRLRDLL